MPFAAAAENSNTRAQPVRGWALLKTLADGRPQAAAGERYAAQVNHVIGA